MIQETLYKVGKLVTVSVSLQACKQLLRNFSTGKKYSITKEFNHFINFHTVTLTVEINYRKKLSVFTFIANNKMDVQGLIFEPEIL